jgi:hypothetical protein
VVGLWKAKDLSKAGITLLRLQQKLWLKLAEKLSDVALTASVRAGLPTPADWSDPTQYSPLELYLLNILRGYKGFQLVWLFTQPTIIKDYFTGAEVRR